MAKNSDHDHKHPTSNFARSPNANANAVDPDYRDNDTRSSKEWAAENPGYWKQYRQDNPAYADRNRNLQHARNQQQRGATIANEDVSSPLNSPPSGRYRLVPLSEDGIANGDAWIVEIAVLSSDSAVEDA